MGRTPHRAGMSIALAAPAGEQDVLLSEAPVLDTQLALRLLSSLAQGAPDLEELTPGAFEVLLMTLRRRTFGDRVIAEGKCPAAECRATIDVSFSAAELVAERRPARQNGMKLAAKRGWYSLSGATFRPLSMADRAAAARADDPEGELIRRSVRPAKLEPAVLNRIERAIARLDPLVSREISGDCPECGGPVRMYFDVQSFVLEELRQQAALVFDDVHLLASQYHWSEERILALPRARRRRYVERIREERMQ
jgi:hypothetical protein